MLFAKSRPRKNGIVRKCLIAAAFACSTPPLEKFTYGENGGPPDGLSNAIGSGIRRPNQRKRGCEKRPQTSLKSYNLGYTKFLLFISPSFAVFKEESG